MLSRLIASRPWLIISFWAVAVLLSVAACFRLKPAVEIQDLLGQDAPEAVAFEKCLEQFALSDELMVLVETDGPDHAAVENLRSSLENNAALKALGTRFPPPPDAAVRHFLMHRASIGMVAYLPPHAIPMLEERLSVAGMRQRLLQHKARLATPGPAAAEITRRMLQDPLDLRDLAPLAFPGLAELSQGGGQMAEPDAVSHAPDQIPSSIEWSADGHHALIRVVGQRPATDMEYTHQLVDATRKAVAPWQTPAFRISLAGAPAMADAAAAKTRRDLIENSIGSGLTIMVLFFLLFRRPAGLPALMISTCTGIVIGFGLYALIWPQFSPLVAVSGALLAGMGIDYGIHTANRYQVRRKEGRAAGDAAAMAAKDIATPLLAASATTILGFLALMATRPEALKQLALLSSLGLLACVVTAATLMPALMSVMDRGQPQTQVERIPLSRIIGHLTTRLRWWPGMAAAVLLAALALLGVRQNNLGDLYALHPQPNPALEAQKKIEAHFGHPTGLLLALAEADSTASLRQTCQEAVRRAGDHFRVLNPLQLVPDTTITHPAISGTEAETRLLETAGAVGFKPEKFRPYGIFLRQALDGQPPTWTDLPAALRGSCLPRTLAADGPHSALLILIPKTAWSAPSDRTHDVMAARSALAGLPVTLTGPDVLAVTLASQVRRDLPLALGLAVGLVMIWIAIQFRSLLASGMAILPLIGSVLAIFAATGLGNIDWNPITLATLPMVIGVATDNSLFLTNIYLRTRGQGKTAFSTESANYATPVFMTCLTTILGFGTLAFSSVPAVAGLGILSAAGVLGSLLVTLFVVAPFLAWRAGREQT